MFKTVSLNALTIQQID